MSLAYLGRHNLHTSPWTATRDALLVQLWGQGYSASEIADQMSNVSRCAVLGRVHRLKLPGRQPRVTQRKPRTPRKKMPPARKIMRKASVQMQLSAPTMRGLALLDLTPTSCRWPLGDGPFLFCGAKADGNYCPFHKRMAWRKEK